jgi:hypothetical protein
MKINRSLGSGESRIMKKLLPVSPGSSYILKHHIFTSSWSEEVRLGISVRRQYNPHGHFSGGLYLRSNLLIFFDIVIIFNLSNQCRIWQKGQWYNLLSNILTNLKAEVTGQYLTDLSDWSPKGLALLFPWGLSWNNSAVRSWYYD